MSDDWQILGDQVSSRLEAVSGGTAVAFAAITAERALRLAPEKRAFTESLRPLLGLVWRGAAGDGSVYKAVAVALGEFYISDYCHNDGQDGPDDADDDPAAAIVYAAECYFHVGMSGFAALVASRSMDAAAFRTEWVADRHNGSENIDFEARAVAAMVAEARQQLADLDALMPYDAQLSRARSGQPAGEHERLLTRLRSIS